MSTLLSSSRYKEIARLYRHPWDRSYAYGKLRTDPLYPAVASILLRYDDGRRPLLDVGCGQALFAFYLRHCGFRAPIHGIDYDARKIAKAEAIAAGERFDNLFFRAGDAREDLPEVRGHVVILDILQYFGETERRVLLRRASERLADDGMLLIRTGLDDASWRYRITHFTDRFAQRCLWMKGAPVCYPRKEEMEDELRACGLRGAFEPLWGRTPFNNYLGVFRRRQTCSPSS